MSYRSPIEKWETSQEWIEIEKLIKNILREYKSKHPGIITEAIVDKITGLYELKPHSTDYPEKRKNHQERIRRFTHDVFRALDAGEEQSVMEEITALVIRNFILTPKQQAASDSESGSP